MENKIKNLDTKLNKFNENLTNDIKNLDTKLSNEIKNLDTKLNKFNENLTNDIKNLDTKLSNEIKNLDTKITKKLDKITESITNINNWIKKQEESIEVEITESVTNYFENKFKDFFIIHIGKIFPKEINDKKGNTVTEFDGLHLVTNDINYVKKINKIIKKETVYYINSSSNEYNTKYREFQNTNVNTSNIKLKYYLLIVEAKEDFLTKYYNKKLHQLEQISKLIIDFRNKEFKHKQLEKLKFDLFDHEYIGLYVGGNKIQDYVINEVDKKILKLKKEDSDKFKIWDKKENYVKIPYFLYGYTLLNGNRFTCKNKVIE